MATLTIIKPESNFTMVSNRAIRDAQLSFRAVGLYSYLISLPRNASTSMEYLTKAKTEGLAALRTARQELEAAGYLRILDNRHRGRFAGETWALALHPGHFPDLLPGVESAPEDSVQGRESSQKCENHDLPACTHPPAVESPAVNRRHNKTSQSKTIENKTPDKTGTAGEFLDEWNAAAEQHSFQKARALDGKRGAAIKARLAEKPFREGWRAALAQVPKRRWRLGENDRQWLANVDWFLRPGTVTKLLEEAEGDQNGCGARDTYFDQFPDARNRKRAVNPFA